VTFISPISSFSTSNRFKHVVKKQGVSGEDSVSMNANVSHTNAINPKLRFNPNEERIENYGFSDFTVGRKTIDGVINRRSTQSHIASPFHSPLANSFPFANSMDYAIPKTRSVLRDVLTLKMNTSKNVTLKGSYARPENSQKYSHVAIQNNYAVDQDQHENTPFYKSLKTRRVKRELHLGGRKTASICSKSLELRIKMKQREVEYLKLQLLKYDAPNNNIELAESGKLASKIEQYKHEISKLEETCNFIKNKIKNNFEDFSSMAPENCPPMLFSQNKHLKKKYIERMKLLLRRKRKKSIDLSKSSVFQIEDETKRLGARYIAYPQRAIEDIKDYIEYLQIENGRLKNH